MNSHQAHEALDAWLTAADEVLGYEEATYEDAAATCRALLDEDVAQHLMSADEADYLYTKYFPS